MERRTTLSDLARRRPGAGAARDPEARDAAGETLGERLVHLLPEASGRTRKQLLVAGRVRLNGAIVRDARRPLAAGDRVEIAARSRGTPPSHGLEVVHEDRDVLVVVKPAGLLTIATVRERQRTAYAALRAHLAARRPPERLLIVHRLDRDASGLLVFAKSPEAKATLQADFAAHAVERVYLAAVEGHVPRPAGTVSSRLVDDVPGRVRVTRDPTRGRAAVTHWRVVRAGARRSLLEVRLETGRRNQIRVHLASIGHPIVGDVVYGRAGPGSGRLALHAGTLGFTHPTSGKRLRFDAPPPPAFGRV
jgi:23S rRNA pseudouridine1911/1915/1917 synthase